MEYLSNIELYFCSSFSQEQKEFQLMDDEFHHSSKVMRNHLGDKLFASDGNGKIFEGIIEKIGKEYISVKIQKTHLYQNELSNFIFCIPNLKNPDRLKFALEKCTELGVTNFIIFNSERTIVKNQNIDRLNKIILSAMKQSLRAFLPSLTFINSLKDMVLLDGEKVVFDQLSSQIIENDIFRKDKNYLMIFGPEGGLTEKEIELLNPSLKLNLSENRLRTETAIIKAAVIIS
jgi:16S rRNA (uracil1498-N3)-methyltransferase